MTLGKAHWNVPLDYYRGRNPDNIDFYDKFDPDDIGDGSADFHVILRELTQRASDSGRTVILGLWETGEPLIVVAFPAAETFRHVFIGRGNCAMFKDIAFEDYEFLAQYHAIWSNNSDIVEAKVEWDKESWGLMRYLAPGGTLSSGHVVTDPSSGAELRFGRPSSAAQALLGITDRVTKDYSVPTMTVTLVGTGIRSVSEAVARLEIIGNAFLFQVSLAEGSLPSLAETSSRSRYLEASISDRHPYKWDLELSFPRRSIQAKPLALYY